MTSVVNALASFHQITNAEFHAQPASGQRHIVQLFSEIAFPDYGFRDALATKKSSFFGLTDENTRNLADIMSTQFPHSGNQPGFVHVAIDVEIDNAKTPYDAVFYTFVIYVLKELRKEVGAEIKREVEWSVLLPDGRHAYVDDEDDGVFWVMPDDDSKYKEGAMYKLEANLQPLAQSLSHCMESSGIADGARAQVVCLERVAGVRPAAEPDAAPAAPTAPSPQPSSQADDDPIGAGGFITPPEQSHGQ